MGSKALVERLPGSCKGPLDFHAHKQFPDNLLPIKTVALQGTAFSLTTHGLSCVGLLCISLVILKDNET